MDDKAAEGSTDAPVESVCDNYAEELEEQLLLLLDEDQAIIEGTPEYPSLTTSAGEFVASANNYNVNIMYP